MTMPHGRIFVIGDSHIGLADGAETPITGWIDRLEAARPRALYLNGDVFHYLIAHAKFETDSVRRFFARLRALRDSGVEVHYVEGNRDFFIKGSFVEDAVTAIADEFIIGAGQRRYLIVHGDMINDRDWPYRFWRFASKNPVTRIGVELIPRGIARRFVDSVEQKLARSNFKHKTRLPVDLMEAYARRRAADGCTDVVFGHFHNKLVIRAEGTNVVVLPAWYESHEAMMISPETGDFSFVTL